MSPPPHYSSNYGSVVCYWYTYDYATHFNKCTVTEFTTCSFIPIWLINKRGIVTICPQSYPLYINAAVLFSGPISESVIVCLLSDM